MKIGRLVIRSLCLLGLWLGLGVQAHAQSDTVTYVYTDPQGTPLVEADAQGNVVARYDYTPYGSSVVSLGNPPDGPGYTGHVNDPETGLVYMQARYYDPTVGRFLSIDPIEPASGNLFNFNRYGYASNNPINHTDPDGRQSTDDEMGIVQQERIEEIHALGASKVGAMEGATSAKAIPVAVGMIPVVGDAQNISTAISDPSGLNIVIAAIGVIPEVGGEVAQVLKDGGSVAKDASSASKVFSSGKQALVDMAKADKRTGMTSGDMQAYKDLNKELPDPFPTNKVRGPETHSSGAPTSQQPHGHVGPVDHIPIRDP